MYESLGSQFFRTTAGIQSGRDAFDESRFIMTFLTTLRVMKISCSFRLVLEEKKDKKIPESTRFLRKVSRVLRKDFSKRFSFIRCRRY